MRLGHPVAVLRQAHAHDRHVERTVGGVGRTVPEGDQGVDGDSACPCPAGEVTLDEGTWELVDARRHGCVRGEHRPCPHGVERLVEAEAGSFDEHPDPLQAHEPGMTFVGVEHRCGFPEASRPDPAHAEHDLLSESMLHVAAVEPIGDEAQVLGVVGEVGVQQVDACRS
ncbi:MAG: hypothetical protein M5U19_19680 [Microthrixaceae bacterium]|nr:hypothetical protein [Microthrixaceae bacterium]